VALVRERLLYFRMVALVVRQLGQQRLQVVVAVDVVAVNPAEGDVARRPGVEEAGRPDAVPPARPDLCRAPAALPSISLRR
jgi:hypothetical protein